MMTAERMKELLEEHYPLQVKGVWAVTRHLYRVQTADGYRRLARVRVKPSRLIFAYAAAEKLRERGFEQVLKIYLTHAGATFFEAEESYWVLMDWVNGREPELGNLSDVEQVTRDLARMHRYMAGIFPVAAGKGGSEWAKLPDKMLEGKKLLDTYLKRVKRAGAATDFDQMLLNEENLLRKRVAEALKLGSSLGCQRMMETEREERSITYYQMKEKEVVLGFDGRIYFVNPLQMQYDVRVKDLGQWLQRVTKKQRKAAEIVPQLVRWYEEERPLSRGEKEWLLAYLLYPAKLIKTVERYMLKKKRWSEEGYVRKLRKTMESAARELEAYEVLAKLFREVEEE